MEKNKDDEIEIDLSSLFHAIVKKLWIVILCTLLGAGVAGSYTKFLVTPMYSASSKIYTVSTSKNKEQYNNNELTDLQVGSQLVQDYQELATSRPVVQKVIDQLHLNISYEELKNMIEVLNVGNESRFLEINVKNEDPEKACSIANGLAKGVQEQAVIVMHTDKPTISEEAIVPKNPIGPNLLKNTVLGGLLGAIIAIAIIVIRYLMDDTIKTEEDIEKYLGLNTLAVFTD